MNYIGKNETIIEKVRGKRVLHLGCVGFTDLKTTERVRLAKESLHYFLTQTTQTTGIDYSYEAIEYYKKHKVFENILYGNVEQLDELDISHKFDVIVAGDIIEHLSNPGSLLNGIKRFCHEDTTVIITTPNSFSILNFLRFVFGKFKEGEEHVMTFNAQNISHLLKRHGFIIESIDTCYQPNALKKHFFHTGKKIFDLFPKFGGTLFILARYS